MVRTVSSRLSLSLSIFTFLSISLSLPDQGGRASGGGGWTLQHTDPVQVLQLHNDPPQPYTSTGYLGRLNSYRTVPSSFPPHVPGHGGGKGGREVSQSRLAIDSSREILSTAIGHQDPLRFVHLSRLFACVTSNPKTPGNVIFSLDFTYRIVGYLFVSQGPFH